MTSKELHYTPLWGICPDGGQSSRGAMSPIALLRPRIQGNSPQLRQYKSRVKEERSHEDIEELEIRCCDSSQI